VSLADALAASHMSALDLLLEDPAFAESLDDETANALMHDWSMIRRPGQIRPANMGRGRRVWLLKAGRGYGKTRTGAEETRDRIEHVQRIAFVGVTVGDVRDTMIEGESGLHAVFPGHQRPEYIASKRRVEFHNGAFALIYSGEEPDRLRGPQHEWAWVDEPASFKRRPDEMLSNLLLGLRLGAEPWALFTGTPKTTPWLRDLAADPRTVVTGGSTYENIANLSPEFVADVLGRYEGTRLGRQELHAEFLDDVEGALWTERIIERFRWHQWERSDAWTVVVGVDPPGETAECGIVTVAGPTTPQETSHAVVLADDSMAGRPEAWGRQVVATWKRTNADRVLVERNQGGDMVRAVVHAVDPSCPVEKLTAKGTKQDRASPIATLYERGRIHHVGYWPLLEEQMVTWVPSDAKSPDRIDALVHALTEVLPITILTSSAHSLANVPLLGWQPAQGSVAARSLGSPGLGATRRVQ